MRTDKFLLVIFAMSIFLWQCGENPFGAGMENEVEIEIRNNQFNPNSIAIQTGTRVIWVNRDMETHSVDPGTLMNGTDDFVGSKNIDKNDTFEVTFTKTGTMNYYCVIHRPIKQGTIIVQQSTFY